VTKLGLLIVELLERDGPMHTPAICKALDRDYAATVPIMTALLKEGAIRVVGKAAQFRFSDVKSSAPVYGATGLQVELVVAKKPHQGEQALPPPPHNTRRRDARQRTNSGSGVIAGPIVIGRGYATGWGRGRGAR
jgi:hypothetical protein